MVYLYNGCCCCMLLTFFTEVETHTRERQRYILSPQCIIVHDNVIKTMECYLVLHRWLRLRCRKGRKVCRVLPTLRPRSWAAKRPPFSARRDERKSDAKLKKQNATEQILCSISVARKSRLDQYLNV
jgi:hypothetical protein